MHDGQDYIVLYNNGVSVPDEGYSSNVPDEGYSSNVPDEGYSRNALIITRLYVGVVILLTCGKHLLTTSVHHENSLAPPLFIEVHVPSQKQESERSCMCQGLRIFLFL
jgi:hypothetical protein